VVRAWCFLVFLQSPPFSALHARSVLTDPAKAKITITNAQCTSATKFSMVCLLLIKGLRRGGWTRAQLQIVMVEVINQSGACIFLQVDLEGIVTRGMNKFSLRVFSVLTSLVIQLLQGKER